MVTLLPSKETGAAVGVGVGVDPGGGVGVGVVSGLAHPKPMTNRPKIKEVIITKLVLFISTPFIRLDLFSTLFDLLP